MSFSEKIKQQLKIKQNRTINILTYYSWALGSCPSCPAPGPGLILGRVGCKIEVEFEKLPESNIPSREERESRRWNAETERGRECRFRVREREREEQEYQMPGKLWTFKGIFTILEGKFCCD